MSAFVPLAALLVALAALFLAVPLLRREGGAGRRALDRLRASGLLREEEYREKLAALTQAEAHRGPPRPALALLVALLLAAAAVGLYLPLGTPPPAAGGEPPDGAPDLEAAARQLAARLEREPGDVAGWVLLGRSWRALERFPEAREAFARAAALAPEDPELMIEHAEAIALADPGRRLAGEPLALLERALALRPEHPRGLWLRGIARLQAGEREAALADWERLLAVLPPESEVRPQVERLIAETRGRAAAPPAGGATAAEEGLEVIVELDEALRARVRPEDTLFVFARPAAGGRMPVAIRRLRAAELPVRIRLGRSDAMMPELTLERFPEVVVGARISRSGLATPQSGDLEGLGGPVPSRGGGPVRVRIDRVLP
ncbi:MAG: tetratricopeptide repeat protein [Xanthomonadales bacterium]|nr:tetratricopeptide repeat protein [Xanthomonadales bacterium]